MRRLVRLAIWITPFLAALAFLAFQPRTAWAQLSSTPHESEATALPLPLQEVFNEGVKALKARELDRAEKSFLRVLNEGGKAAFVYNNLGILYQLRGDQPRAVEQFRQAIHLQPNYGAPRVLLGSSLLALNRVAEATRELEVAVKLQPRDPLAHLYLAKAYEDALKPLEAVDQYQILNELSPQDPEYAYQMGKAYLGLAAWCYQQMVRLEPRSSRRYQSLAENYRREGRLELAAKWYQKAILADPSLPEVHLALAEIFLEQGKLAEARTEVEQELSLFPESSEALALKKRLDAGVNPGNKERQ
jgi:tetratricopeptide (TPR) repeat protein